MTEVHSMDEVELLHTMLTFEKFYPPFRFFQLYALKTIGNEYQDTNKDCIQC